MASVAATLAVTTSSASRFPFPLTSSRRSPFWPRRRRRCPFTNAAASSSRWRCDRCAQTTCAASFPAAAPSACELTVPGVLNPLPPALGPPPGVDTPL